MDKLSMRVYLADLESRIDMMLKKWKKQSKIENGEAVQAEWQFEQCHIILDIFWEDMGERVNLHCLSPRIRSNYDWSGLTKETSLKVMDRIGNFAQIVMSKKQK